MTSSPIRTSSPRCCRIPGHVGAGCDALHGQGERGHFLHQGSRGREDGTGARRTVPSARNIKDRSVAGGNVTLVAGFDLRLPATGTKVAWQGEAQVFGRGVGGGRIARATGQETSAEVDRWIAGCAWRCRAPAAREHHCERRERTTELGRQVASAQGRRTVCCAAGASLPTTSSCARCCTCASCALRMRTRKIVSIDTSAAEAFPAWFAR